MANSAFNRALLNDKSPQLGGDLDLNGFNFDFPTTANISDVIDDDTMGTASATSLATSESIKAYVDGQISGGALSAGDGIDITTGTISVDLSATPFLEFSTGELQAKVLDEDNMVSNSATDLATQQSIKAYADTKVPNAEKGAANGVAELDATGRVPASQLSISTVTYEGTWDAATNTPTLSDAGGIQGQMYIVDVAGTQDLGSGSETYDVGDYIIHNGTDFDKIDRNTTLTDAEVKVAYENNANTNEYSDAEELKVSHLTVTQAVNLDTMESDIALNNAARHDALTLNIGDATQQSANISGQELELVQATGVTDGVMSAEDKSKLDGIESGATADQTGAEIKSAYEAEANTNAFTDAEKSKLSGIEANAKDDQSAAEVPYSNGTSGLTATDTQAAIDEVEGRVDTLEGQNSEANEISVAQAAHGLAVGDIIRHNGTIYVTAQADSAANAEALGIVSSVADAGNFAFIVAGKVSGLSTLTAGTLYYLDPTTAGDYTSTAPTTTGQVDKPLFVAVSTTEAILVPYRGIVLD